MKKIYISLGILVSALITSFLIYVYLYLPNGSCVQVVVNATNRITRKTKVFGSSCAVPFWYKDVTDFSLQPLVVGGYPSLSAPGFLYAEESKVDLLLLGRECNKTYKLERSYNKIDWEMVGTPTFYDYSPGAGTACPADFIDSTVIPGTKKLWYRYGLLDKSGNVTKWSDVAEVMLE